VEVQSVRFFSFSIIYFTLHTPCTPSLSLIDIFYGGNKSDASVMAAELTRQTHKTAIQLHLFA